MTGFDVPLTIAEQTELERRLVDSDQLADLLKAYAVEQPEYAGLFTAQDRGGIVVVQFTDRLEEHREAMSKLVHPDARFEVVRVRWTSAELRALVDRVFEQQDWLGSIGAEFTGGGVDTERNLANIKISSKNPHAGAAIIEHFGAEGRMYVESDGTGFYTLPLGTLLVKTVDRLGRPVVGMDLEPDSDVSLCCEARSMGQSSEIVLELRAAGWMIRIIDPRSGREVGHRHAVVSAGQQSAVTIVVAL
ncbi:MAG: hypothetical protein H0X16_08020 [Chloroflexi bacterium]|nr:hypothetical protein [Chloroflexota bacterium]